MKILFAGDWQHAIYEPACANALQRLGVTVIPFQWSSFFSSLVGKAERKYNVPGLHFRLLNRALVKQVDATRPDVVLVWRGVNILPETLNRLKRSTGAVVISYNNDDPFSPLYADSRSLHLNRLWRYFTETIRLYDCNYVYRTENISDYNAAGSPRTRLLRSYYIPSVNKPVRLTQSERDQYGCDLVFIGHGEEYRYRCLEPLAKSGHNLKVYGGKSTWLPLLSRDSHFTLNPEITGEDYNKALCGARLCLCFFSRLNRDSYTRRVFEITACGGVLLSERTSEMQSLFREGSEALYFSSPEELQSVVASVLGDPERLNRIAEAGRLRCLRDGHSVEDRMTELLDNINTLRKEPACA